MSELSRSVGKEPACVRRRLGRVAPMVRAGWFFLDVGLRFLPPQWFRVNPVTIAGRDPGARGSFQPRFSIVTPFDGGDATREVG